MKKQIFCLLAAAIILLGGFAMAEFREEAWYGEALKESVVSPGNNVRLKNVIERAQGGEMITIATVGGSITEGALASKYEECWAVRFVALFGENYGTNGGKNVTLVNSGVGGTPSPFGYMRYGRDILARVPEEDPDGYPDLVVIEYAVNDWAEPTKCRCYESMVKEILEAPNAPAVILLFSARNDGWNVQDDLQKIGERYNLPMVSVRDGIYPHLDKDFPKKDFYKDEYHPNSTGHGMMADALMQAVADAVSAETSAADTDLTGIKPVYGTDFMGLKSIYGDNIPEGITVERGSFDKVDKTTYSNTPVGQVCGKNFCHGTTSGTEPMKVSGVFRKCLIAWKAAAEDIYGTAEILVDGEVKTTLKGGNGKWGQSEVVLVLDEAEEAEHTVEIRVVEEGKRFTVTAISVR